MKAVDFVDIEHRFDELIAQSGPLIGADPVCSTSRWIVPAAAAFAPKATPRVYEGESGIVALLEHDNPAGPVLTSFDTVWGFATPLASKDPAALVEEMIADLLPQLDFYALSLSGIDPSKPIFEELQRLGPVGYTESADRCIVDLHDGFDSWLERRSPRFRRSLRAAVSRAEAAEVRVDHVIARNSAEAAAVFDRVLSVERRSWKASANSGLVGTDLGQFTLEMAKRFATTQELFATFATIDPGSRAHGVEHQVEQAEIDIGYVIGGRVGGRYRGFQHSFDKDYADLSLGKLLQFHTIRQQANSGALVYDLGMYMDYNKSYQDRFESTISLICSPGVRDNG